MFGLKETVRDLAAPAARVAAIVGMLAVPLVAFGSTSAGAKPVVSAVRVVEPVGHAACPAHCPAAVTQPFAGISLTTTPSPVTPDASGIVPSFGPVAGGTVVVVSGRGFTGTSAVHFGSVAATSFTVESDTTVLAVAPASAVADVVDVTVTTPEGTSIANSADRFSYRGGVGYWVFSSLGAVYPFGSAAALGQPVTSGVGSVDIVGAAGTPDGGGYWIVSSAGGIYAYGDATFLGSPGQINPGMAAGGANGVTLAQPIVGMASTPDGGGYWEIASDGGLFAFGDAGFFGSPGQINPGMAAGGANGVTLARPIVGMAATPDGGGYWEVASDGGLFAFGDAGFFGSTGAMTLAQPIVALASTPDGKGYWEVASDGGMFAFGNAGFFGSAAGSAFGSVVSIVSR